MPFNEDWPRFLKRACEKVIKTSESTAPTGTGVFFYEGGERKTNEANSWYEIRFNGPDWQEMTKNQFRLRCTVNVQCACNVEKDFFRINKMMGWAASLLHGTIGVLDDADALLGCLQVDKASRRDGRVRENGLVKQPRPIMMGTVEVSYYVDLVGT